MRIRLLVSRCCGDPKSQAPFGQVMQNYGDIIDEEPRQAKRLIACGHAEAVDPPVSEPDAPADTSGTTPVADDSPSPINASQPPAAE